MWLPSQEVDYSASLTSSWLIPMMCRQRISMSIRVGAPRLNVTICSFRSYIIV